MKLVVTDTNWADEMDVWGFEVVSDKFFDVAVKTLNYYFENISDNDLEIWVYT